MGLSSAIFMKNSDGCIWSNLKSLRWSIIFYVLTRSTDATSCNDDQLKICRDAASMDSLNMISSGGHCMAKRYDRFSHLCTIPESEYLPSIVYCCCQYEQFLLCCRYRQGWNQFRCKEDNDTVAIESAEGINASKSKMRLVILLSIFLPVVTLGFIVFFVVFCHNHQKRKKYKGCCIVSHQNNHEITSSMPDSSNDEATSQINSDLAKCLPLEPSAPSENEVFVISPDIVRSCDPLLPHHSPGLVLNIFQSPESSAAIYEAATVVCPTCATRVQPPPTYDESMNHMVLNH